MAGARDVVIVLGAQNDAQGKLTPMAVARAQGALAEYRRRQGARVLVTGGFGSFNPTHRPHACYLGEFLVALGVERSHLLPYVVSAHTVEDAALAQRLVQPLAPSRICLVTSRLHMERALFVFHHFFPPGIIHAVPTPDAVDEETRLHMIRHEKTALEALRQQGGILMDGHLVPTPANLDGAGEFGPVVP